MTIAAEHCAFLGDKAGRSNVAVHLQVIELPIKHPELFESLGVAQPKVSQQHC